MGNKEKVMGRVATNCYRARTLEYNMAQINNQ